MMKAGKYLFVGAFLIYIIIIFAVFTYKDKFVDVHTIVLSLFLVAFLIGQSRSFLREFVPFTIIIFAYQIMRGYADDLAGHVNIGNIIRVERFLFGNVPTVVLQKKFYTHGSYHIYDFLAFTLWALHFVVPLAFAFILWRYRKRLYWQFVLSLICLTFAGFITYVIFPLAPPWLASRIGDLEHVSLIRDDLLNSFQFGKSTSLFIIYATPNHVAAMPSLHAAYPCLVFLYILRYFRKFAIPAFIYCIALWTSLVYGGDHYVLDVLVGIIYAVISFFIIEIAIEKTAFKKYFDVEELSEIKLAQNR